MSHASHGPSSSISLPERMHRASAALRRCGKLWNRKRVFLALLASLVTVSFLLTGSQVHHFKLPFNDPDESAEGETKLHVLVPANKGEYTLCRLMLASSILGYPTPHLLNWGLSFAEEPDGSFQLDAGTHLAKVTGVIKWLWSLEKHQSKDLVLVIDAYDLTLQLPPAVLIKQYHRLNRDLELQMSEKPGMQAAMKAHGLSQTVVFSADKRCSPQYEWEPWCYLQPVSPLPPDLYGNRTDTTIGWDVDKLQSIRPRWLNSGMVLGPADDMLAVFTRAYQQLSRQRMGSDQSLFHFVFAEQEFLREHLRQQHIRQPEPIPNHGFHRARHAEQKRDDSEGLSAIEKIVNVVKPSSKDYSKLAPALDLDQTELHIGLDYFSRLSKTTVSASHEVRRVTYNTTPPTGNMTRDPRDCHGPYPVLLEDLEYIDPPFPEGFNVPGQPPHPRNWADCPLWTDMCSGQIPVSIHHNGHKMNREFQWPEMWYHRYAKEYLAVRREQQRIAESTAFELGIPIPDINDGGAWASGKKLSMEDICAGDAMNMVYHGCMWGHGWDCAGEEHQPPD